MRPTIICNLTPDAVALLQLIKSKSIDFQKIGSVDSPEHVIERAREFAEAVPKREGRVNKRSQPKRGSGRRTVNGVVYKTYRKDDKMSPRAYLAEGHSIKVTGHNPKLIASLNAVVNGMTEVALKGGGKVLAIRRDEAVKAVKKVRPDLHGWSPSAVVSTLHKRGGLKVVV